MSNYGAGGSGNRSNFVNAKTTNLADNTLSTTYLKLEPIKRELTWTGGVTVTHAEVDATSTSDRGTTYTWNFGSTVLSGLTTGVLIQFVEYDIITKCEKILHHCAPTIGSANSMSVTYLGKEDQKYDTVLAKTRGLGKRLLEQQTLLAKRHYRPILKMYVLPANYVTKQIQIGTIQSYWQDPSFDNVMWVQHTSCCSFTTGPFSPTLTAAEGDNPSTLTQGELRTKAATGLEVFHNIIPELDKIMTYAN